LLGAIAAMLALAAIAFAAGTPGTWVETGAMSTARGGPGVALLQSGKVLAAGGSSNTVSDLTSAEVYDPASGSWGFVTSMTIGRGIPTAVTLQSGKVLVVAGSTPSGTNDDSAEVYDPVANAWTPAANKMSVKRAQLPNAVLLNDGRVLVVGGLASPSSANADLYNPATNSFSAASAMGSARGAPAAILLPGGKVLVAGGADGSGSPLSSAEVYNPASNSWANTANSMSSPRIAPTISLLPNGKVLIAGGESQTTPSTAVTASADIYDPSTNSFTPAASMHAGRVLGEQTTLGTGQVLVAGGASISGGSTSVLQGAEVYDPATNTWNSTGSLNESRAAQGQVLLPSGQVLDAGGISTASGSSSNLASAELYTPLTVPSAPQSVSASAGNGQASVTWAPAASDGGAGVQHYTVKASTGQTVTTPDARTFATVTGLANGTPVTFTVTATNSIGTGPASAASNSVTPNAPPPPVTPSVSVSKVPSKISLKSFLKGLGVTLTPNEPVSLDVSLLAFAKGATIARVYNLTLAEKILGISGSKSSVKLVPSRKLVGRAKSFTVQLRIVATDAAGNRVTVTKTIKVVPPKKKH
jgi:N-acetylneuraminic acid mutarotase